MAGSASTCPSPGLNKGLDIETRMDLALEKLFFIQLFIYYLVKFSTQKVIFVNELFSEPLV